MAFEPFFSNRVWHHVQVLLVGAILAPGKRTVTAALRIMGLSEDKHFQNYHRGLQPVPIRWVLIRDPEGKFEPQALLCTMPDEKPLQILKWFVRRWQVEVTFQEARTHLVVETQRQWSDLAITRTTPALFSRLP